MSQFPPDTQSSGKANFTTCRESPVASNERTKQGVSNDRPDENRTAQDNEFSQTREEQLDEAIIALRRAARGSRSPESTKKLLVRLLCRKGLLHSQRRDWGQAAAVL